MKKKETSTIMYGPCDEDHEKGFLRFLGYVYLGVAILIFILM